MTDRHASVRRCAAWRAEALAACDGVYGCAGAGIKSIDIKSRQSGVMRLFEIDLQQVIRRLHAGVAMVGEPWVPVITQGDRNSRQLKCFLRKKY